METDAMNNLSGVLRKAWRLIFLSLLLGLMSQNQAMAFTLNVVGSDGVPVTKYRWLVQEDTTKDSQPGDPAVPGQHLSLSFHASYAPVVAKGDDTTPPDSLTLDANKRYFVSVLPDSAGTDGGYTNGGAQVAPATTVTVNKLPLKTAQISVYVFEDNNPINNAPDLPAEKGLAGFTVQLFEAGGSYGANGGRLMYDVFGNLLGTTYNQDGSVLANGSGVITTDINGVAKIKNLAQGKYTVFIVPPAGQGWVQTATIEGTPGIDAWVKPNEPAFFQEFGPPGHHVFVGFTKAFSDPRVLTGGSSITGRIVNQHMSRSPDYAFYNGDPVGRCWVGLNEMAAAPGKAIHAAPCNADSTFSISNVPAGRYQLVVWDEPLDVIFASHIVDVPAGGGEIALMDVPVFSWFGRVKGQVFFDNDANGFPDPGEVGIKDQAVNLRFRDGSIYQMQTTDAEGTYEFGEVFPFFNWLVAEVDFARFKATGVTVTVDGGGPIDPSDPWSFDGTLTPQAQSENSNMPYRTETGPVLVQGVQTFLGQANVMQWGKKMYDVATGENGGISGIVRYATTRAENDPRYAAGENWEPGIPNVTVNLYQDFNADGIADGPAIQAVTTDNWDASVPTNCQGDNMMAASGVAANLCFDGLRNFNQVRPAVFDGGYAFGSPANPLPPGTYIVEAITPPGYEHVKEEDKNVDFGDTYVPSPLALPPACVGTPRLVPAELSLFPGVPTAFAGQTRPLCDRKQVKLAAGQNAAADFFMFTEVPVAGQIVGMILNDLANEFDPAAPNFGEKYAPPHMPISIRDWSGREISRVYSDAYGTYNALVPSTYTINAPMPSGVSPNMLTACLNSPMKVDGTPDPYFNRQYSQFCYTFQYMPGKTTYLDTPVLPIAAMAGPGRFPLDCEYGVGTPMIHSVTNGNNGPWVSAAGQAITILSLGQVATPNPAYDGTTATPKTIMRDYGFGATQGTVGIVNAQGVLIPLTNVTWASNQIIGTVPANWTDTTGKRHLIGAGGQLVITRGDNGQSAKHSVTMTVGNVNGKPPSVVSAGQSIQAAIDAAAPGDLITVAPGVYEELVVMHKPVKLQGWGPGSVTINAVKAPAEKLTNWRNEIATAYASGWFDLLPGQVAGAVDPQNNEPILFNTDEGAGVTVLANRNEFTNNRAPRIDGFTITGADHGGGVYVNGYANNLLIANNRIVSNQGYYGGGIHVGNPALVSNDSYTNNANRNLTIRNNQITQNGSLAGAGGGISLYKGSDNYKVTNNFVCGNFAMGGGGGIAQLGLSNDGRIAHNTVIFNESFNQGQTVSGGGVLIAGQPSLAAGQPTEGSGDVTLVSNLIQGNLAGAGDGGGIRTQLVNGADVSRTPKAPGQWYKVDLFNNIIVNNIAGLAGGGISMQDTARINIVHNTIANNDSTATAGSAFAAGSPNKSTAQPAGVVSYKHSSNLVAAFGTPVNPKYGVFSNPWLSNNIIWQNESFFWEINNTVDPASFGLQSAGFADLAVVGGDCLTPNNSVLTPGAVTCSSSTNNITDDPEFLAEYRNTAPGQTIQQTELTTGIATAPAFDEGGNFIDVNFGPLTLTAPATGLPYGNYHIGATSPARGVGSLGALTPIQELGIDFDQQARPQAGGSAPDAGADEIQ